MDTLSQNSETTDTSIVLLDALNGSFDTLLPIFIISSLVLFVLLIISMINHHKQRQRVRQAQEDIHAIRELLEKRFGNTTSYVQRNKPLSEELQSDPQVPARP